MASLYHAVPDAADFRNVPPLRGDRMEVEVPGWLRPTVVIWHGPQPNDLEKIVMTAEATGEHDPPESHRERLLAIAAGKRKVTA